MYFSYSPFSSPPSSASSSAASSPAASHTSTPTSYASTSYHASPYQTSSPINITSPCAYPSWPTRPSLQSPHAPYAHTAASSYLSDDDLSPLPYETSTPVASPVVMAREVLDTSAIRDLLLEESARKKARKAVKVGSKTRRRGSGGSERSGSGKAKLSTIIEGSYIG